VPECNSEDCDLSSEEIETSEHRAKRDRVGLCVDCRHMRTIESSRGSTFYLCQRSATDLNFPKYPRLPVKQCAGYEPVEARP
jgi:hypothetical protein